MDVNSEPHAQEKGRSNRTFRDQHERRWSGIIEQSTGHWVMPLHPKFEAPIIPPSKYIRPAPGDAGDIFIDYMGWHHDLKEAWTAYEARFLNIAQDKYTDTWNAAMAEPPKWLRDTAGIAPLNPDVPRACLAGTRKAWILGFSDVKPEWAYRYFPREAAAEFSAEVEFPDAEEEGSPSVVEYPVSLSGGWKLLSNGQKIQASMEEAIEHEKAIKEFAGDLAAA